MGDVFGESFDVIDQVFAVMAICPQLTFIILTKRPERMERYFANRGERGRSLSVAEIVNTYDKIKRYGRTLSDRANAVCCDLEDGKWPLPNVWLGVSVEDQKTADERIPLLLQTPAVIRFVSVEPMLGPVGIARHFPHVRGMRNDRFWVICGPETGPGARRCDPAWIKDLHTQCVVAGVPFFDKRKVNHLAREFPR
jgi:protein gp37